MAYEKFRSDPFAALADPTRRAIFERVARGPAAVGDLARGLPVSRPAVSRHLAQLERAGLVAHRAEGTRNVYYLDRAGLEATASWLNRFWDEAEARLRLVAENTEPKKAPGRG